MAPVASTNQRRTSRPEMFLTIVPAHIFGLACVSLRLTKNRIGNAHSLALLAYKRGIAELHDDLSNITFFRPLSSPGAGLSMIRWLAACTFMSNRRHTAIEIKMLNGSELFPMVDAPIETPIALSLIINYTHLNSLYGL